MDVTLLEVIEVTSIIFYLGSLLFSDIIKLRTFAFLSTANDLVYAALIGSVPIFAINTTVGATNSYRLLESRLSPLQLTVFKYICIALVTAVFGYGVYEFVNDPSLTLVVGWANTFLVIAALSVAGALALRWLFLSSAVVGFGYGYLLDSPNLMFIKASIFFISIYHLVKLYRERAPLPSN